MIGTLTQAFTQVEWGGQTLHAYEVGDTKENVAQQVSVNLNKSSSAPTASFEITPNPAGFKLFQELKANALDKPFLITFGYLNGSMMGPMKFLFSGVQLTTGHTPKLEITGTALIKGAWTDNKISFTMEEPTTLEEYPKLLQEKCGAGCKDLSFEFVGLAKEKAAQIEVKGNQMQRTPQNILTDVLRPHGMDLQVSDNMFDGKILISYSPAKEGETEVDKAEVNTSGTQAETGSRKVYIIGPGLMTNLNRNQKFNTGSDSTNNSSSATQPNVPQVAAASVTTPQQPAPQTQTTESKNEAGGTSGQANPGSGNTGSAAAGKEGNDASAALSKMITTTINFSVLMVPYMVGVKPRDFIAIPSLKGPGDYIEDWEVSSVQYKQGNEGGVTISISGARPYTGEDNLLDKATIEQVKGTVSSLTSPEAWNRFYWIQGGEGVQPLSN